MECKTSFKKVLFVVILFALVATGAFAEFAIVISIEDVLDSGNVNKRIFLDTDNDGRADAYVTLNRINRNINPPIKTYAMLHN